MSKVASYLRGHLLGEIEVRDDVRQQYAHDSGVLKMTPEMVILPRNTNDIRKVARFAWQLAEKGHVMPLTSRGSGIGSMGGAIGKGAVVSLGSHMDEIFEYDSKQRLVRLQPGVSVAALRGALSIQGTDIPAIEGLGGSRTIGGVIAENINGLHATRGQNIQSAVNQLEVVLANGEALQTSSLNKRELNAKKGLQTFEGDIYRGIDTIIEDYHDVISSIPAYDHTGYNSIADVKKDGKFDLSPLFVGSNGTLGVISEMILQAEFQSKKNDVFAIVCSSLTSAVDAMRILHDSKVSFAEYFDAKLFDDAVAAGKSIEWYSLEKGAPRAVIIGGFNEFNSRMRSRGIKKLEKAFHDLDTTKFVSVDTDAKSEQMLSLLNIDSYEKIPDDSVRFSPDVYNDIAIPVDRFEDFAAALAKLEDKLHCRLPISGHVLTETYAVHPQLALRQVSDKQKLLRLVEELASIASDHGGAFVGGVSEGKIASHFAYKQLDNRTREMYAAIKKVFDPFGILNPGTKESDNLRSVTASIDGNSVPKI